MRFRCVPNSVARVQRSGTREQPSPEHQDGLFERSESSPAGFVSIAALPAGAGQSSQHLEAHAHRQHKQKHRKQTFDHPVWQLVSEPRTQRGEQDTCGHHTGKGG